MTAAELMEVSNETLALYAALVDDEKRRRKIGTTAVRVHEGNVISGRPAPLLVRVIAKVGGLSPSNLAKVEAYADTLNA
jgi:hypothetical protein